MTTKSLPARTLRGSDIATLVPLLNDQRAHTIDLSMAIGDIEFVGGNLALSGRAQELTNDGFFEVNGLYRPVPSVDNQLDSALGIPAKYIRRLREENVGLLDTNLNELVRMAKDADPTRKQLVRLLWGEDEAFPGSTGVLRAFLSNAYAIQDNLDTVMAVLAGLDAAGLDFEAIKQVDLSNDRLYMTVVSQSVATKATELLKGYRDPRTGTSSREVGDIVRAGMIFSNSEVGSGSFSISPFIEVLVCKNGMVQKKDVIARRHVGGRLPEGEIKWSDDTRRKANDFVSAQVRDATEQFLSLEYVDTKIAEMEADAGIELSKPMETIEVVSKELGFTKDEQELLFAKFTAGGVSTSGGILHAVTAAAQDIESVERSFEFGAMGVDAMKVARRHAERISA